MTPERTTNATIQTDTAATTGRVRRSQEPICAAKVPSLGVNTGSTPCDVSLTWTRLSSVSDDLVSHEGGPR